MRNHRWPTREEWAKDQRALYHDRFEDLDFDGHLSAYASPTEVEILIRALRELWKAEGARMRSAKKAAGQLTRQPGETRSAYLQRSITRTPEEDALILPVADSRWRQTNISETIKLLQDVHGPYPRHEFRLLPTDPPVAEVLEPIVARYEVARKEAEEKRTKEILATPIDDAAWEEELQRRADLDRRHP